MKKHIGLDYTARRLLSTLLPTCYLEGYDYLNKQSEEVSWPKRPKFIFTSNNFTADEIFKIWVAKKTNEGYPYYAGQHGANYGTNYFTKLWSEIKTSDKFISWGWDGVYNKVNTIPAFNFKVVDKSMAVYDCHGGLLLLEKGPGGNGRNT